MIVKVSSIQSAEKESSILETSNRLRNILHSAIIIMPSTAHKSTFLQMYTTPVTALPPIFIKFDNNLRYISFQNKTLICTKFQLDRMLKCH